MSIANMDYNPESKSLEITIKFFTDDLEAALESNQPHKIYLATEKEISQTDSLINIYLDINFLILQKEKKLVYEFLGKEAERDYTLVYLELENFNYSKPTTLINKLLINSFEDQVNKVNYKNGELSKSINMHKNFLKAEF